MSHKHKVIIEKVFSHPIASNIDWKKLAATLEHFGAKIDVSNANRAHIILDDAELILSLPHHAHELTSKEDVTKLRHFLEAQGITPDSL
ncbi:type II toxin-antitoxin system HicA family toxin [Hydrogenovibrio crunogenus]|uniref:Type II toxin-antitoxin system HicA family toxin n=1 Tax=Hydrogenovibrio crunogenus TaxID=39765 RepID=A0A4V1C900_9GAMM|nr:hypothetical protein [Hydrogenovibrio crunogenus]QBZ83674.1 type II toxin-antitoxin system HicA family toxin [Hydrogenovibrio crunogenus]